MNKAVYNDFSKWLNQILSLKMPDNIVAYNFNLYEGDNTFQVQLAGSSSFSENDADWACDTIFSSEENIFTIHRQITGKKWEEGLLFIKQLVINYLENGDNKKILLEKNTISIGFVDGDLEILYKKL